jgi:hypothetical protein
MNDFQTVLLPASANVFGQIANFLPKLFGAVLIFLVGIVLSNWAKVLTSQFVKTIRLEKLLKNTDFEKFLKLTKLPHGLEELLGQVVRWIILLIIFIATMNLLGLTAVADVLGKILGYIPNVLSATLILAIGILVAGVLEGVVKGAITHVNGKAARLLGKVTSYTIMVFALLAAISELHIARQFIQTIFTGFVATLTIALGLSFGLGGKDIVAKIMKDWYEKSKS